MLKNIRFSFFSFLIGVAVTLCGIVLADKAFTAKDILFSSSNSEFPAKNVGEALDMLYDKVPKDSFCMRIYGEKYAIGTRYMCDPGDGAFRTFYVLKENEDTVEMIATSNLSGTASDTTINTIRNYFISGGGASLISSWSNFLKIDVPKGQDIINAACHFDSSLSFCGLTLDGSRYDRTYELPGCETFQGFGCEEASRSNILKSGKYWLYEESNNTSQGGYRAWMYLDSGRRGITNRAQGVSFSNWGYPGIRPVVTVAKADL